MLFNLISIIVTLLGKLQQLCLGHTVTRAGSAVVVSSDDEEFEDAVEDPADTTEQFTVVMPQSQSHRPGHT